MEAGGPLGEQARHRNLGWGRGGTAVGGPWTVSRASQRVGSRTWQGVRRAQPDSMVTGEDKGGDLPPTCSRHHSGCREGEKCPGKCLRGAMASGGAWAGSGGEAGPAIYL